MVDNGTGSVQIADDVIGGKDEKGHLCSAQNSFHLNQIYRYKSDKMWQQSADGWWATTLWKQQEFS